MNITLYHWGLHGWVVYTIMGLLLGLMAYREGLPMTLKSCFYPLIGDKVFGWPGDLIDTISVIATLFGVCTSLGLGTIQINQGLHILNEDINVSTDNQVIIIWCITALATVSVLSGVKHGIRRISEFCFACGVVLMLCILFLDNTVFLLNLYTQSLGYYFHQLVKIGFHSDAFEQLGPSHGAEDRGRVMPEDVEDTDGPVQWMEWWTIFYWGWWIAWCPFVGMFIAKISYGRTIKEFIFGTMAAPTVYVFMWLIVFGGVGLRLLFELHSYI
jgi:choline-glycine betaine transporter